MTERRGEVIANTITIEGIRRSPAVEAHVASSVDLTSVAPAAPRARVYELVVAASLIAVQAVWVTALALGAVRLIG